MKKAFLLVFLLAGAVLEAEVLITPLFSGALRTQVSTAETTAWPPKLIEPASDLWGGFEGEAGEFHGQVLGGLNLTSKQARPTLPQAWLSWEGEVGWSLKAGWWPEPTGPAVYRSLVPTFTTVSGTAFLASAGTAQPTSPLKGRLTVTGGEFSVSLEAAGWDQPLDLPDAESLWFPRKDVLTQFEIGQWATYHRANLKVLSNPSNPESPPFVQGRGELRWSALWGEVTAGLFRGKDPQVVFPYQVTFPQTLAFDLTLTAQSNLVTMQWATVEIPVGEARFWTEQRLTQNRLRVEGDVKGVSQGVFVQTVSSTEVWEGVLGASYTLTGGPWGSLKLWTEGSLSRDLTEPTRPAPDYHEGWEGGLSWDEARGLVNLSLFFGQPWDPTQGWVWGRAAWTGWEGRTLWIGAPLFWGAPETTWGQFADRRVFALGTTYQW